VGIIEEELDFHINISERLKKITPEVIFLVIFAGFLLAFIAVYEGGVLKHDSPYQLIAGDMFTFQVFSEVAKDTNNYDFLPPYLAAGHTNAANMFSPTPGILVAEIALLSGAETHDILLHLNIVFLTLMIAGSYLALRYINKDLAPLGIPLGLLIWKWPFSYVINWGAQLSVVNFFFAVSLLLTFFFLKEKGMFIVFGIINAASFIAHGREFQTFNVAVILFFFIQWIADKFDLRKIDWHLAKNYLFSLAITVAVLFRYIPIWKDFAEGAKPASVVGTFFAYCPLSPDSYHYVSFAHLGIFKWLIIIGIIFALLLCFKKTYQHISLTFLMVYSLTYILSSYFCIYGNKTTQIRHFFPIFLIPILAICMYNLVILFNNNLKEKRGTIIIILAIILIIIATTFHYPKPVSEYPVSNPLTWEGIKWVERNTPEDSKVVVLYGDNFYQESLFYLMKRPFYNVLSEKYLEKIKQGRLTPTYNMTFSILGNHYVRESLFKLKRISYDGPNGANLKEFEGNLCNFDYVFSNKVSRNDIVSAYTQTVLKTLITESKFIPVFENDLMIVLQNKNVGGACFTEKKVTA